MTMNILQALNIHRHLFHSQEVLDNYITALCIVIKTVHSIIGAHMTLNFSSLKKKKISMYFYFLGIAWRQMGVSIC